MINKIYKSLSLILSIAFISGPIYAKSTVTWWAEANADRDPVFQAKLVDVFNLFVLNGIYANCVMRITRAADYKYSRQILITYLGIT